jgi:hypothetical protein
LGRSPEEQERPGHQDARRHTARRQLPGRQGVGGFQFPWRFVALVVLGLFGLAAVVQLLLLVSGPARVILAPVLVPVRTPSPTRAPPTITPTVTLTPIPIETRILRTPVPTEYASTPLAFMVESTPTPTTMLGMTPHPQYEAYAAGIESLRQGQYDDAAFYMRQVTEDEPDAVDAWYFLGEANRLLGRPGAAVEGFDRAVLKDPDFARPSLAGPESFRGCGRTVSRRTISTPSRPTRGSPRPTWRSPLSTLPADSGRMPKRFWGKPSTPG